MATSASNTSSLLQNKSMKKLKKPPEVRQTLTSKFRMLKANPLLRYQMESTAEGIALSSKNLPNLHWNGLSKNLPKLNVPTMTARPTVEIAKKTVTLKNALQTNKQLTNQLKTTNKPQQQPARKKWFEQSKSISKPIIHVTPRSKLVRRSKSADRIETGKRVAWQQNNATPYVSNRHPTQTPRSVGKKTPKSVHFPSFKDLDRRLSEWLKKRGKRADLFKNLKQIGNDENKENIEVVQNLNKTPSYERLNIKREDANNEKDEVIDTENMKKIALEVLADLHQLISEGYPNQQCEAWLKLIYEKFDFLRNTPEYWDCKAAIEQGMDNFLPAIECYKSAIIHGAEVASVDKSLDNLLSKFSVLNIDAGVKDEKNIKILQDARNVFKSSIIQFAVQARTLRKMKTTNTEAKKVFIATPVRRSTRLSRNIYATANNLKVYNSLGEVDSLMKENLQFQVNNALI